MVPVRVAVAALLLVMSAGPVAAQANKPDGVDLGALVRVVNSALVEAQTKNVLGFPELKKAVLALSSTVTKEADGKVKFLIFSIGGSKGTEASVTLSVEMTPPATAPGGIAPSALNPQDLKSALALAINQAKAAFVQANQAGGKLKVSEVEIEVKFGVSKNANGGVDTGDLLPISFELTGKIAKEETQSITLTFGK